MGQLYGTMKKGVDIGGVSGCLYLRWRLVNIPPDPI